MKNTGLFRWFLYPFAMIYGIITFCRNKLYDSGILASTGFPQHLIGVGNLSSGGTGKTPHVEYLVNLWKNKYAIATLSRGYKRKTKGFVLADENASALKIGDEPMQIYRKFPDITVVVGEKRVDAVRQLLIKKNNIEVIVLDDVFQHRSIKLDVNILLTDFHQLFTNDYVLPMGNLREFRRGYKRADVIVITKCPNGLLKETQREIIAAIRPLSHQRVLFSYLHYHQAYSFFDAKAKLNWQNVEEVFLVCGIAKPDKLVNYLASKVKKVTSLFFGDHHDFKVEDLEKMRVQFKALQSSKKVIITTEKDAVRLDLHRDWLQNSGLEIYCLPIEVYFEEKDRDFLKGLI